ncbi:MAG: peptide deformylase [Tatlockia sp.]|nr:peptide deformylase [Tatlockia sp.]
MKTSPHNIFNEYKEKILDTSYYPTNAIQTLKARLTASWLLLHSDPDIVSQAEAFIQKTSTFKEADLSHLKQLASQINTWDEFQICSAYTNIAGNFLEYKLSFTTLDNRKDTVHFHAQFETKDHRCCFVSQTSPLIRVIGDPILHQPGALFPQTPTSEEQQELLRQIELAKSVLIQTSGAGIAANQCAALEHPYRFTIVGVFYEISEHVQGVERRYPSTKFPQARIMINPVITAISQETQSFNHGCLSVPCSNRCTVLSPIEMSVTYKDPIEEMSLNQVTFSGVNAVVLWHELTHILSGKTYMDVIFESLSLEDLNQFQKMLLDELQNRTVENYNYLPELTVPPFHLSVKANSLGFTRLDKTELDNVLPNMTDETLAGLLNQAQCVLRKKNREISELLKKSSPLFIDSDGNRRHHLKAENTSGVLLSKL